MISDPFLISTIAALAAISVARSVHVSRRRTTSRMQVARLTEQVEEQAAQLENVEATVERQLVQLNELQERLDFAERLLFEHRDRTAVGAG